MSERHVESENSAIARAERPNTRESLAVDLRALGVAQGMTLLVHASLSALGWVAGGPVAVVQALIDAVTPQGTLVMPANTADNSDPADWLYPPVPEAWWPIIRAQMPGFDPAITPTRMMGRIAETLRTCIPECPRTLIFGTTRDKDLRGQLRALLPLFDRFIATRYVENPRSVPPREVVEAIFALSGRIAAVEATPGEALERARRMTAPEGLICVTGSLFLAAETRAVALAACP